MDDKKLIFALTQVKETMNEESKIESLRDIEDKEEIGNLDRMTIKRLCKKHRIAANQKLLQMIKCLEDKWDKSEDENAWIESLDDVHIDDIADLSEAVLIKLCKLYKIKTTKTVKKKTKKKRKKKQKNKDDEDEFEEIKISNAEMITLLEEVKERMNEKKKKKTAKKYGKIGSCITKYDRYWI